jgi:hypothetical protein
MSDQLDTWLTMMQPKCIPATTSYDHEEFARFYLALLTDPEYPKYQYALWDDYTLLLKARQHVEAAKLLRDLDDLHSEDEED